MIADGAHWIWDRAKALYELSGLDPKKVTEVVDWCHAVEKLHEVSKQVKSFSEAEQSRWVRTAERHLYFGDLPGLMACFDDIGFGRRGRSINKHRPYFEKNIARMQSSDFSAAHQPVGSGAVESAIRRVVNMRLKGSGSFWLADHADSMLLVRCYLKAGRLDDLIDWSITRGARWWPKAQETGPQTSIREVF